MRAIILLGGPGAGKGTLSENLRRRTDFIHVSTGDMLRAALQSGSPVGMKAKSFMESGSLVPDSVVLGIIEERIEAEGAHAHFMFDGFPRTIGQAEGLDFLFTKKNARIRHVFNLVVPHAILISRLTGRRVCRQCGAVYHLINKPPVRPDVCDLDGGGLYQRADDSEATILNRLDVYEKQTAPLIAYYEKQKLIRTINAGEPPEQVAASVLDFLGE
ncbi:MAG: adenylate kinase [Pontiellaceae bacterium]|jgi:adenylate kinase|nr:adenylate kinase [Pontiellaceae bacterium]